MARLFERAYELTISEPVVDVIDYSIPPLLNAKGKNQLNFNTVENAQKQIITNLDMSAIVTKTKTQGVDQLDISIYNLNKASREILETEGAIIILKAGYLSINEKHEDLPVVFMGQRKTIAVSKKGNHTVTDIVAGDGVDMMNSQRVTLNLPSNTLAVDVIEALANSFSNVSHTKLSLEDIEDEVMEGGYSATGLLRTILHQICDSYQLAVTFTNNTLYIQPKFWNRVERWSGIIPVKTESYEDIPELLERKTSASKAIDSTFETVITVEPDEAISAKKLLEDKGTTSGVGVSKGVALQIPAYLKINLSEDIIRLSSNFGDIEGDYTIASSETRLGTKGGEWVIDLDLEHRESGK